MAVPSRLARASSALVVVTWALLVVGASVRVNGAGLACPDWPLCFGEVVPPIDFGVAFEFGHRVLAGLVSLGFLGVSVAALRDRRRLGRPVVAVLVLAALTLVLQIVLGGLTVLHLLAEWTVASHLVTGNAFCALLLLLALAVRDADQAPHRDPVTVAARAAGGLVLVLVPVQLGLGGFVAGSNAGLACGTWPGCNGPEWFPTFAGSIGLQVLHRLVAYALLVAGALTVALAGLSSRTGRRAALVMIVLTGQAVLGIANVWLRLPVEITLLHTAGAAAVVLSVTALHWELWRAPLALAAVTPSVAAGAR